MTESRRQGLVLDQAPILNITPPHWNDVYESPKKIML
jgi:hypothetical protein